MTVKFNNKKSRNVKLYKDKRNKWRWRVVGENGEIVGSSSQGFVSRSVARANVSLLLEAFIQDERSKSRVKK